MPRSTHIFLAASLLLANSDSFATQSNIAKEPTTATMPSQSTSIHADNPLLQPSTLAYQMPAFDKIKDSHYGPAFELAMREHSAEIAAIANNSAAPSFDNTVVALEKIG